MNNITSRIAITLLIVNMLAAASLIAPSKSSQLQPAIFVDPPLVEKSPDDTNIGDTFVVQLNFSNMVDLTGIEYKLYWRNDVLNCTSVHDHLPWSGSPFIAANETNNAFNATHGCMYFVCVSLSSSFSGSGNFRNVTFTIVNAPVGHGNYLQTPISFGPYGSETIFGNSYAELIPAVVYNGMFRFAGPEGTDPDVAILRVEPTSSMVLQNSSADIEVEARNQGDNLQSFTVSVYANGSTGLIHLVDKQSVSNLQGHTSQNMMFVWNTTGTALGSYRIFANATTVPGETDTTDNTFVDGTVTVTTSPPPPPPPAQQTAILIDPNNTINSALAPGQTFTVSIKVANVVGLAGYEYKLHWAKSVLEFVSVHDTLPSGWSTATSFVASNETNNDFDAIFGRFYFVIVDLSNNPFTGSYTAREVTFRVKSVGSTALDLQETILGNPQANNIPHNELDGFFSNSGGVMKRELAITNVEPSTTSAKLGDTVNVAVTAANNGDISELAIVRAFCNSSEIGQRVVGLSPGMTETLAFAWVPASVGTYALSAEVEIVSGETNTTDNTFVDGTVTVTMPSLPLHDLAITSVVPSTMSAEVGDSVNIAVQVANQGEATENAAVTVFCGDSEVGGKSINLPQGETSTLVFPWVPASAGSYVISAKVAVVAGETHTVDNILTDGTVIVTLPPPPPNTAILVDPPAIIDRDMTSSRTFNISIKIINVTDLYGVEFKLLWNATAINLTDLDLFFPWSPTFVAADQIDPELGQYWLSVTAMPPANPYSGNTTIAILTFTVLTDTSQTVLKLSDTILGNPQADSIPHNVLHGFFSNYAHAKIESCNSEGESTSLFGNVGPMHVRGSSFTPLKTYNIYIVNHTTWIDGMPFPERINGTATTVESDVLGNVSVAKIWAAPLKPGEYDIVVDVDGDGFYNSGIDALDEAIQVKSGPLVIPEFWFGPLAGLVGCFAALGIFRAVKHKRGKKPIV